MASGASSKQSSRQGGAAGQGGEAVVITFLRPLGGIQCINPSRVKMEVAQILYLYLFLLLFLFLWSIPILCNAGNTACSVAIGCSAISSSIISCSLISSSGGRVACNAQSQGLQCS